MPGRLLPYGDRAVLVEVDDLDEALALHERLHGLIAAQPQAGPHPRARPWWTSWSGRGRCCS